MTLRRRFERCEATLSVLGAMSYVVATFRTVEPAVTVGLVGLPLLLGAWWFGLRRGMVLPRWGVNTGVALVVMYAVLRVTVERVNVEIVAELVVFLSCIKIADRRSPRDDAQILLMAVFLAIAALLTNTELLVGLLLLPFVPLLVGTVMLFHLYSAAYAAGGRGSVEEGAGVRIGPTVAWATLATLSLTLFVFIIMPRGVGGDFLGEFRGAQTRSQTAFTDRVNLGSRNVISESPRIVLELQVTQTGTADHEAAENLGSAEVVYYLRGAVLEEGSPGMWTAARGSLESTPATTGPLDVGDGVPSRSMIRQEITIRNLAGGRSRLFSLWKPVTLRPSGNRATYIYDKELGTVSRDGGSGTYTYTAWSATPVVNQDGLVREPIQPTGSAPIRELASGVLRDAGLDPDPSLRPATDDARAARAIQDHLRRNFTYSLDELAAPAGANPVEHFLFQSRQGHCEYFAAAMVALCRGVGINARMIAGYAAAEFSPSTGKYTVRASNAHAWVEAESGRGRWLSFDPTPPADFVRIHRPPEGLMAKLRQALESVEYAWNSGVVGFDEGARQRIFTPEDGARQGFFGAIDNVGRRLRFTGPRTMLRAVVAGAAAFVVVAVVGLGVRWAIVAFLASLRRPALIPAQAGLSAERRAQVAFYARALEALKDRGLGKPDWRPPLDHASDVRSREAAVGAAASRVGELYYKATFGDRALSESELKEAEGLIAVLTARPA